VALSVGIVVLYRSRLFLSKILFVISALFSLWVLLDLITWMSTSSVLTMVAWSLLGIAAGLIEVTCFYFFYVFIFKKDMPFIGKTIISLTLLPIIFLTPTIYNLAHFDVVNCEAAEGFYFTNYYYLLGYLIMFGILLLSILGWRKAEKDFRREIILISIGLELFLLSFTSLGFIATYLDNYYIEFYGLFGMNIFMIFLTYAIIRFKTFDVKLIATQALVWASAILIGSQFFFIQTNVNRVLTGITLIVFSFVGWMIVRSVKKEIRQKEEIEHLLKIKSEFIDIVSHQLRTPVSVIRGMASMLKEGDLDDAPKEQKDQFIAGIYEKSEKLADILNDILKAAELDMDNFTFAPGTVKPVNLVLLVKGIFTDLTSLAEAKKLNYQFKAGSDVENLNIMTDDSFLKHALQNIIDNGIKYSREGGFVTVDISKDSSNFICKIIDSGIGIPADQASQLFEKFVRAKNAVDVHAYGTGLGLFIAKKIVEAHPGGRIWFESVINKGTTFYIKLPIAKQS
jgi:signal transduction histidine kinase